MSLMRPTQQIGWRQHLTSEETRELKDLEEKARKTDATRRALTDEIRRFRDRVRQRAKYRQVGA